MKKLIFDNKLLTEVYLAETFSLRLLGYMFQNKPKYDALLLKPCNSIHTFFMKFNIDVLFLNENMKVLKKVENLGKNKIVYPVKEAQIVIEAMSGAFTDVKEGNQLILV